MSTKPPFLSNGYPKDKDRDRADPNNRPYREPRSGEGDRPAGNDDSRDRGPRPARFERGDKPARFERSDRPERSDRSDRPERSDRFASPDRPGRSSRFERGGRPGGDRPDRDDRPRLPRGGLLAELRDIDKELLRVIVKRTRMLSRLPGGCTPEHERELRTSWEANATLVSRDPRLIRQMFALIQEIEVVPADADPPSAFNLAPVRRPVSVDVPVPASDRLPRLLMSLAASSGSTCTLSGVPLNDPVLECLKGLNQLGANLRWEGDGRILCQDAKPIAGRDHVVLDKVLYVGSEALNLYLVLFQLVTRTARVKIIGEKDLRFVDLAPLRHFLPLLGARLTSLVPGQEGLPARLESSAMLPAEIRFPAELPSDAVVAFCMAAPAWDKECTLLFEDLPEKEAILAEVLPILLRAGARVTQEGDVVRVVPGKATPDEMQLAVNIPAAATLLSLPAFAGGTVCLRGVNDTSGLESMLDLLKHAGLVITCENGALSSSCPEGQDGKPQVTPLADLSSLPASLLPLGLALSLIPLVGKGGVLPILPEDLDRVLLDSFLHQVGLIVEDGKVTTTEPTTSAWASPCVRWALALSLAAFLRPNIKLVNPGVVQAILPHYWALYNGLPAPVLPALRKEVPPAAEVRPQRRRVMASYTPESEMPDEIVYPDE